VAVPHPDDPPARGGDLRLVGDDHEGLALVPVEASEEGDDLGRALGVEVAGGLVGQDQLRPVDQRPRDRGPLLLATRQLGRLVAGAIGQTDGRQRIRRGLLARAPTPTGVVAGKLDVGTRLKSWKTKPISWARSLVRWFSETAVTSRPSKNISGRGPWFRSGWWSSPRMCMRVLLPEPEGPMIATISPGSSVKSTPRSASTTLPRPSR
jgi:hypothetical protein